jgi:predicted LPLAT superfamily acyltransferase
LAAKFDIPVLTLFVMKESAKHYHVFLSRIDRFSDKRLTVNEKIDDLARNYVSELERILEKYPEQWYNFYKFWN